MFSLLNSSFFEQYAVIIVLVVALGLLMFYSYRRKRTEDNARFNLSQQLKEGTKVKTYSGIYGVVISTQETTDGKVLLLETGEGEHVSYITMHANAIYDVDNKKPVVLDAEGKPIFEESEEVKNAELEILEKLEQERLKEKQEEVETTEQTDKE